MRILKLSAGGAEGGEGKSGSPDGDDGGGGIGSGMARLIGARRSKDGDEVAEIAE
jgi:hypothetical protein